MHTPNLYREPNIDVMHALMRSRPLATLITLTTDGLAANHIPFYLLDNGEQGILQAHIARNNPIWQNVNSDAPVLVVFQDVDAYISPSWYASKAETHKVVPTWNYGAVHAHGFIRVLEDAAWIRMQINALTEQQERNFASPWSVSDAPNDYIEAMVGKALMGIEIVITRLEGKWKVSQDKSEKNRASVISALTSSVESNHHTMARLIQNKQST